MGNLQKYTNYTQSATKAAPCATLEMIPLLCQGCNTHWHQHAELTTCFAPKKYIYASQNEMQDDAIIEEA